MATEITIAGSKPLIVGGPVEDVEKALSDAARSGQSRLAWFEELETRRPIGLNPAHVISLRPEAPAAADDPGAEPE